MQYGCSGVLLSLEKHQCIAVSGASHDAMAYWKSAQQMEWVQEEDAEHPVRWLCFTIERRQEADLSFWPSAAAGHMSWSVQAGGSDDFQQLLSALDDVDPANVELEALFSGSDLLSPALIAAAESPKHHSEVLFPAPGTPQPQFSPAPASPQPLSQVIPAAESPQLRSSKTRREYNSERQRAFRQRQRNYLQDLAHRLEESQSALKDAEDRLKVAGAQAALLCPQLLKVITRAAGGLSVHLDCSRLRVQAPSVA